MVWVCGEADGSAAIQSRWLARQEFGQTPPGGLSPLLVGVVDPEGVTLFHRYLPETLVKRLPFPKTPDSLQAWQALLQGLAEGNLLPQRFSENDEPSLAEDTAEAWQETHRTRKEKGRYYTPFSLAACLVETALEGWRTPRLKAIEQAMAQGKGHRACQEFEKLLALRLCDPSVGSGVFLQGAFQTLCRWHAGWVELAHRLWALEPQWRPPAFLQENTVACAMLWESHLLKTSLYGVDVDQQALALVQKNIRPLGLAPAHIAPEHLGVGNALLNPMGGMREVEKQRFTKTQAEERLRDLEQALPQEGFQSFCWELGFPSVFWDSGGEYRADAGFDVVVGNPPWEKVKANHREVARHETEAQQAHAYRQTVEATRRFRQFVRQSGHFPHQSGPESRARRSGSDDNLYKLFVERTHQILSPQGGSALLLVKNGLLGDQGTWGLRHLLLQSAGLRGIWQFRNKPLQGDEGKLFPDIDPHERLCAVWFERSIPGETLGDEATFPVCRVPSLTAWTHHGGSLPAEELALEDVQQFSPTYWEIPVFRDTGDRAVMSRLWRWPRLGDAPWRAVWRRELDMTLDRHYLSTDPPRGSGEALPLWEGRLIGPFQRADNPHRWVRGFKFDERFPDSTQERLAIRLILPNSVRKLNATLLPPGLILGNSLGYLKPEGQSRAMLLYLTACLNSLVVEFWLRHTVSGMTLNFFKLDQLPLPPMLPEDPLCHWVQALLEATEAGTTEVDRQQCQRAIEVAVAKRFELTEAEWAYVVDTFSLPEVEKEVLVRAFEEPQAAEESPLSV
jgi:hypothetical protein